MSSMNALHSDLHAVLTPSPKLLTAARLSNRKCSSVQLDKVLDQPVLVLSGTVAQTHLQLPRDTRPISLLNLKHSLVLAQLHLHATSHFQIEFIISMGPMSRAKIVVGTQIKNISLVTGNGAGITHSTSSQAGTDGLDNFASSQLVGYVMQMPLVLPRCRWVHVLFHVAGIVEYVFHLPRLQSIDGFVLAGSGRICRILTSCNERACVDAIPTSFSFYAVPAYVQPVWTTAPREKSASAPDALLVDTDTSSAEQAVLLDKTKSNIPSGQTCAGLFLASDTATPRTNADTYTTATTARMAVVKSATSISAMPALVKHSVSSMRSSSPLTISLPVARLCPLSTSPLTTSSEETPHPVSITTQAQTSTRWTHGKDDSSAHACNCDAGSRAAARADCSTQQKQQQEHSSNTAPTSTCEDNGPSAPCYAGSTHCAPFLSDSSNSAAAVNFTSCSGWDRDSKEHSDSLDSPATRHASNRNYSTGIGRALTSPVPRACSTYLRLVSQTDDRSLLATTRSVAHSVASVRARIRLRDNTCWPSVGKNTNPHLQKPVDNPNSDATHRSSNTSNITVPASVSGSVMLLPSMNQSLHRPYSYPCSNSAVHTHSFSNGAKSNSNYTTSVTTNTTDNLRCIRASVSDECDASAVSEWVCASVEAHEVGEYNQSRRSSTTSSSNINNSNRKDSGSKNTVRRASPRTITHRPACTSMDGSSDAVALPASEPESTTPRPTNESRHAHAHVLPTSSSKSLSMAGLRLTGAATEQKKRVQKEKDERAARLRAVATAAAAWRRRQQQASTSSLPLRVGNVHKSSSTKNSHESKDLCSIDVKKAAQKRRLLTRRRLRLLRSNDRLHSNIRASHASCLSASGIRLAEIMPLSADEDDFFVCADDMQEEAEEGEMGDELHVNSHKHHNTATNSVTNDTRAMISSEARCGYGFGYLGVLCEDGSYVVDSDADLRLKGALSLQLSDEDDTPLAE